MSDEFKDRIKSAKEMFRILEDNESGQIAEIAKRTFCIQDRLATTSA